ncbi:hypothetical protein NLJ89_g5909 [Agrocybe chaxingu]|uniref:Uncharacterized protein n=1 Tax=Agrocybe chaxingu TaxID=84603 RepID=A0A9W8K0C6_9AGAR|nr:hypothetical protein NLJ89_g5909 [Agrocybe chaxingu]
MGTPYSTSTPTSLATSKFLRPPNARKRETKTTMTAADSKPTIVVIDIAKGDVPGCTGTGLLTFEETGKPGQRKRRLISTYNVKVTGNDGPGNLDMDKDGNVLFIAGASEREDGVYPPFMRPGKVPWWLPQWEQAQESTQSYSDHRPRSARGRQERSGGSYSNNVGNVGSFNNCGPPGAMPGMSMNMGTYWPFGPGWNPMAGMYGVNVAMGAGPSRSKHGSGGSGSVVMVNSNSGNVNSIIGSNNSFSAANAVFGPPRKNPKKSNRESFVDNKGNINSFNRGPPKEELQGKKGKDQKVVDPNASAESFGSTPSWSTCDSHSSESSVHAPIPDHRERKSRIDFSTNGNIGNVNSFNQWGEDGIRVYPVATSAKPEKQTKIGNVNSFNQWDEDGIRVYPVATSAMPEKQTKVETRPPSVTTQAHEDVRDTSTEDSEALLIEDTEIEAGCWGWLFPWRWRKQARQRAANKRAGKRPEEYRDDAPPSYEEVQVGRR